MSTYLGKCSDYTCPWINLLGGCSLTACARPQSIVTTVNGIGTVSLLKSENELINETLALKAKLKLFTDIGMMPIEITMLKAKNENLKAELAEYKQSEKDGSLVRIPCKVGDTVYEANTLRDLVAEYEVTGIIINKFGTSYLRWRLLQGIYSNLTGFDISELGKTVFLTREAAEAALRREV